MQNIGIRRQVRRAAAAGLLMGAGLFLLPLFIKEENQPPQAPTPEATFSAAPEPTATHGGWDAGQTLRNCAHFT